MIITIKYKIPKKQTLSLYPCKDLVSYRIHYHQTIIQPQINQNIINEKISGFKKKVRKNIYKVSILTNKGLINIKKILVHNVHK